MKGTRLRASRWRLATALALLGLGAGLVHAGEAATPSTASGPSSSEPGLIAPGLDAPPSAHFERVWHFGRVTGDLERIIGFYHDVLGLDLRGARNQARPFITNAALDEFVANPKGAQFRAVHLPIPGASAITDPADSVSLEAFEYRGIDRRQVLPALSNPGASNIVFLVPDLERAIATAKAADVAFISVDGASVEVPTPPGFNGHARAVMLRDPDGYPIELLQIDPPAPSLAPGGARILGAMMVVVVADLEASIRFYQQFLGQGVHASAPGPWSQRDGAERVRALAPGEHRSALLALPGSALKLELLQFRGAHPTAFRPLFQDVGHAHIALYTHDIPGALATVHSLGGHTLSRTDTWTRFSPTLTGFYTRDPDGFFLEVIERH